ncbi:MAG TPA: MBL fold metallo-hydrolase [Candidatus Binataceae bacterium]|nr:MBL fold metallo-hydrolase [Candidatus Binataceae bacterium]
MAVTLTVLGAGDAFASKGYFQASYLLDAGEKRVLLDAGPTLLTALKRVRVATNSIDLVLISHLHGDHFAGLPFLILEYLYENPLMRRLTIAGPPKLAERTWTLFRNCYPETDASLVRDRIDFVTMPAGGEVTVAGVPVRTMRTPHMVNETSLAFRVSLGGRTVVFSGDSGWTDELIEFSAGSDLFLCECTYFESTQLRFHINYPELWDNHTRLSTRRLVMTHVGREVLEHAAEVKLEMAHDLMTIQV